MTEQDALIYSPELEFFCIRLKRRIAYQECADNFREKKMPECANGCITGGENAESHIAYLETWNSLSKEPNEKAESEKTGTDIRTKKCCKCKEYKPLDQFNKNKTSADGLQYHCRECVKVYAESAKKEKAKLLPLPKVAENSRKLPNSVARFPENISRIRLDFGKYPELFEKVKRLAGDNFRSFNAQVFYIIKTYTDEKGK